MYFPKQSSTEIYLYNRANWEEIQQNLLEASNTYFSINLFSDKSVEENWNFIHQTIYSHKDQHNYIQSAWVIT